MDQIPKIQVHHTMEFYFIGNVTEDVGGFYVRQWPDLCFGKILWLTVGGRIEGSMESSVGSDCRVRMAEAELLQQSLDQGGGWRGKEDMETV